MADETVVGQDAAQIGMASNTMPNRSNASRSNQSAPAHTPVSDGDHRHVVVCAVRAHAQALVVRERQQMRDGGETALAAASALRLRLGSCWLGVSPNLKRPASSAFDAAEKPSEDTSVSHSSLP